MLGYLWDEATSKYIVGIADSEVKSSQQVFSADHAADIAEQFDSNGWDVYFTPSGFDGKRLQKNASAIGCLWIDLDCGDGKPYENKQDAAEALNNWLTGSGFPAPSHIVDSGYGLHCYWQLDGWYTHDDWLPVAQQLKQAMKVGEFHADPARTADSASLMRMPGTHNHKRGDAVPVRILSSRDVAYPLDNLRQKIPAVGPQRAVPKTDSDDEWSTDTTLPEGDALAIAEQCKQMQTFRDKRGAVSEPYWRAGLSILWRCTDGETYIHEWSQGDERYNAQQTRAKAEATAGPATCAHFDEVNPGGCTGCPFAGKVTSPILLRVAPDDLPEEQSQIEPWRMNRVNNFVVTAQGVYFNPPLVEGKDAEGPQRVSLFPLWVEEHRERARIGEEQDRAHLVLRWSSLDNQHKRGVMPLASLGELRDFRTWLGNHSLSIGVTDYKLMAAYIGQYTAELIRKQGTRQFHEVLGWTPKGFVLGDRLVSDKGVENALVQSSNPIAKLSYLGDVDSWVQGVNVLGTDADYLHHAFAVLAGFGSAVLDPAGKQSAVVSLVGPSGAGKTLAANAALSIFGSAEHLGQGSAASDNAIEQQLSCNRHVPYLLDEVTQYTPKRLAGLAYLAANGHGKATLTRNRDNRAAGSWRNTVFVTSNQPLLEFAQDQIQEAHRRRLLELYFDHPISKPDAAQVVSAIQDHYGTAGPVYLQQLARIRGELPALFARAERWLEEHVDVPDANRFAVWTMAAAWIGGTVAKQCGLLPGWDIDRIVLNAGGVVKRGADNTMTNEDRAGSAVREWLTEYVGRISHWDARDRDLGTATDHPVARVIGDNQIAVHAKLLSDRLQELRIPRAAFEAAFDGTIVGRKSIRLAPGTPPVWSFVMDMDQLGFTEDDLHPADHIG